VTPLGGAVIASEASDQVAGHCSEALRIAVVRAPGVRGPRNSSQGAIELSLDVDRAAVRGSASGSG